MPYPFSYFRNLFPFHRAFTYRKALSWPQLLFTWLFLLALSFLPASLSVLKQDSYPLEKLVPQAYRAFNQKSLEQIRASELDFNPLQLPEDQTWQVEQDWIAFGNQVPESPDFVWSFQEDHLLLIQKKKEVARIEYSFLKKADMTSPDSWKRALDQAWFKSNSQVIRLFLLGLNWGLWGLNFFLVTLGSSILLYWAGKSRFTSLKNFKEAFHVILYALGLPTLIGSLTGFLGTDLASSLFIQNSLFVLVLALIFYQTQFRDPKGG